jgi:hypothetical protein
VNVIISSYLFTYVSSCHLECDIVIEFFLFRVCSILLIVWTFVFVSYPFLVSMWTHYTKFQGPTLSGTSNVPISEISVEL